MKDDYWIRFWNENDILRSPSDHLQVGRSINRKEIDKELWNFTLNEIIDKLDLNKNDVLLDLCCGNGLISIPFSEKVKKVISVDISKKLIEKINTDIYSNISTIVEDVRRTDFEPKSFSKIIFYFSLQHFTCLETIALFQKMFKWLKKGGACYIGDIPDIDKLWQFFNTKERRKLYYKSIESEKPIIGTWFKKSFLINLAEYTNYSKCEIIKQNRKMLNSHYRFDVLLKK